MRRSRNAAVRRLVARQAGSEIINRVQSSVAMPDDSLPSDSRLDIITGEWLSNSPKPKTDWEARVLSVVEVRVARMESLLTDDDARREELTRCAGDVVYFLENYGWTLDPRGKVNLKTGKITPSLLPFVPFEKQIEYLRWLEELEADQVDGIAEKSREVGLTWLTVGFMVHRWLFRRGWKGGVGSRKEDLVDKKGNSDSIIEKMRILVCYLPHWMRPIGWSEEKHSPHLMFVNPSNGSVIVGEAGKNIGRGGRNAFYLLDEAAHIENSESVDAALSFNCPVKVSISTVNGMDNTYAVKRHSGAYSVFTFHWSDDPRKNDAWYKAMCEKYKHNTSLIAQELDIDYAASKEGIIIPAAWVRAAVDHDVGDWSHVPPKVGMDIAAGGANETVSIARRGPKVTIGDIAATNEPNTTNQATWVDAICRTIKAIALCYDAGGLGVGTGSALEKLGEGDGEGETRTLHGKNWTSPKLPYMVVPVQSGSPAGDEVWPDGKTGKELFTNLRAQEYFKLRLRFEKTYEHVMLIQEHPAEERISIPSHPKLVPQLSTTGYDRTESGKIRAESKLRMRKRGAASPDFADALWLAFHEPHVSGWHAWVALQTQDSE